METRWKLPETEFPKTGGSVSKAIDARGYSGMTYENRQAERAAKRETRRKTRLSFQGLIRASDWKTGTYES
ncbi:MAG: hypothetical protein ACP5EN_18195 [Rhodovulum sp.]